MARPRKTVAVADLLTAANTALAHTDTFGIATVDYRRGIASMLEHVLHATGNYRGFRYLSADDLPAGVPPGIIRDADGHHVFPDESRRRYL